MQIASRYPSAKCVVLRPFILKFIFFPSLFRSDLFRNVYRERIVMRPQAPRALNSSWIVAAHRLINEFIHAKWFITAPSSKVNIARQSNVFRKYVTLGRFVPKLFLVFECFTIRIISRRLVCAWRVTHCTFFLDLIVFRKQFWTL